MGRVGADADFRWRRIVVPAYGPSLLSAAAKGAVVPIAALRADELGAGIGTVALIVSLTQVGQLLGTLPAGWLVARIGERATLARAGLLEALAFVVAGWAPSLWLMALALLLSGAATSAFFLARQGFMIDVLPSHLLARGMSLLGGSMRTGMLLGPALGSLAIPLLGLQGAYGVAVLLALGSFVLVVASPDLTRENERARAAEPTGRIASVAGRNLRLLLTQGAGVAMISALRTARVVLLPLWALHIGLDGVASSQVFLMAAIGEICLVYPGGAIMDRLGRVWIVAAVMSTVSVAFLLLPFAQTLTSLTLVAVVMALGNGLGSGIVMTLGADAAPALDRAQFLAAWRMCGEVGNTGGSLGLTAVTALVSLPVAAVSLGVAGLLGLGWTTLWVGRADRSRVGVSGGGRSATDKA
ncbi:MFS transporter [Janibacter corallicola]|uniref:MFS transporter n=1 Tax=Janibacter corallicola TaxID=415212 RepID=UPI000835F494|nr:MFS transporter [Janibacter corallicola]